LINNQSVNVQVFLVTQLQTSQLCSNVWSTTKALMSKCFWSHNYRLIPTVQQHENLQLIVASQVDQLW